ncbi:MAG: hypothetical protein R3F59_10555 [Myxococcota bacterium]
MRSLLVLALPLAIAACHREPDPTKTPTPSSTTTPPDTTGGTGLLGTGWANPFPSADLLDADGHLALRDLPATPSAIPVDRLAWRTGFSPGQVAVLRLPGIDDSGFAGWQAPERGAGTARMIDLTDGHDVLSFAELDAYPDAEERALLVRPLEALPYGHDIAVVVTTDAVARPPRFDALLSDHPPADLADVAPRYRDLVARLGELGVVADDIAVAWQFPVADGREPLRSALAQHTVPGSHTLDDVRDRDLGDEVGVHLWRAAEGTLRVQQWLDDDDGLQLGPDGTVTPLGETDADLFVYVPESVRDAPAGSVPVLVFGHGLLSEPARYLDTPDDPSAVAQLIDEGGYIAVATRWRGLTTSDSLIAAGVATDFAQFHRLTDLLVQSQVNTRTLIESVRSGELLDDPVFLGAQGQPLADPDRVVYYGISLGAIEGAVMLGNDPPLDAAAFHVGGAFWSTMLERSSDWTLFEFLITGSIPSAADRQVLYALSQLWWDPVDPVSYVDALDRPFLLQQSIGDEQVPNVTTDALVRSLGLPLMQPAVTVPVDVDPVDGPLPAGSRALTQFDPMTARPPPENRPAPVTDAHTIPRTWDGARLQVLDFLADGSIVHHCGASPCTADNPGP